MATNPAPKLSGTKSIGFRAGPLREQIDQLHADLLRKDKSVRISDILRDGVIAFWPHIEAHARARQSTTLDSQSLATATVICAEAMQLGVTPDQLRGHLATLVDASLSSADRSDPSAPSHPSDS